jgi:acylphosphatase
MRAYEATYEGIVQHVHFRAMIAGLAAIHRANGWVQNQADGSVKVHIEGNNLNEFWQAILFAKRITNAIPIMTQLREVPLIGYSAFTIFET